MLLTYLNDPTLKARFLAEITKHEEMDALLKGTYGQMNSHFKGCAIGCSLHSLNVLANKTNLMDRTGDHARYEKELGVPIWLAYLEDHLFEQLPTDLSKTWPRRFAEAIPVGITVPDRVLAQLLRWMLADDKYGVRNATDKPEIKAIVDRMVALFDRSIGGNEPTRAEWEEAARAAWAAWDAWAAGAARAAWAAWDARAAWAAGAARAAWAAWDARATGQGFYPALSEEVLRLLRELNPTGPIWGAAFTQPNHLAR